MRTFYFLILVLLSHDNNYCEGSGLLRAPNNQEEALPNEQGDRELTYYIGGKKFSGDAWYSDYKPHQIPRDWSKGDSRDYYRNGDKCYKNGTIKRSNCPTPPNCNFTGKHGKAKLCINRLPTPGGKWYVAAIGCIPRFENCDKCMCGTMVGSGKNARCKLNRNDDPDDDQVDVNCYDLTTFKMNNHRVHIGRPRT